MLLSEAHKLLFLMVARLRGHDGIKQFPRSFRGLCFIGLLIFRGALRDPGLWCLTLSACFRFMVNPLLWQPSHAAMRRNPADSIIVESSEVVNERGNSHCFLMSSQTTENRYLNQVIRVAGFRGVSISEQHFPGWKTYSRWDCVRRVQRVSVIVM